MFPQVLLDGQRLPIKSFKDYVDLYVKDKEAPRVHEKINDRWEVCICASEGQFQQARLFQMHPFPCVRRLYGKSLLVQTDAEVGGRSVACPKPNPHALQRGIAG